MIIVIVEKSKNAKTGINEEIVSHGVNTETQQQIVLPWISPQELGAKFDKSIGEYILP